MRIFVTGGSGFIGSAVVPELITAGHRVVAIARSDAAAAALRQAGAEVKSGTLHDLEVLRGAAAESDAVIHLAFIHDFTSFGASVQADRDAIEAIGGALEGSNRVFTIASGILGVRPGELATELDGSDAGESFASPRHANAQATLAFASRGVRASVVRLAPTVHGAGDHGFIATLVRVARERGVSGYIGDGAQRWPAVHRSDAARLFRLAIEKRASSVALHGIAEEGIRIKDIAEAIGRKLDVPVRSIAPEAASAHFGWIAAMLALDAPAANARTRELLGWEPSGPTLLEDIQQGHYTDGV